MSLYRVEEASEAWLSYLDHIDDLVQSGLFQLLQTALSFLTKSMNSTGPPLLSMTLVLQPQGSRFVPSDLFPAGGILSLEKCLQSIVSELYNTSDLIPRISGHRDTNYQPSLKQSPTLSALEQKVRSNTQEVSEKAEHLRAELDQKYGHLWTNSRQDMIREFLMYGRQLGPDEQDVYEAPPTLKEFRREIQKLQGIQSSLTAINNITVLQGWLQVDLQPFIDSVMSLTAEWSHMFTECLLQKAEDRLQKVALEREDQPESSFPLTDTLLFVEMCGVELPPSLSAHIYY
ncbi:hypothetical protein NL108_014782 [Boleophthalmus pectinirostris]|nr:hypothetical protein NL108_014782 [Boleophthalmus pectinirostris]